MSADTATETRAAQRLVALFTAVALAIYGSMGWLVTPDAHFTQVGRKKEIHFVKPAAERFDRDATYGDRRMVWAVGSSITRDAVDAAALAGLLRAQGLDVGFEKYAFAQGAPVFSLAMLELMEVRPGDVVVTSVSFDNFRRDWLHYHDMTMYLQYVTPPHILLGIDDLSMGERIEESLAYTPPADFWHWREWYARGATESYLWAIGLDHSAPEILAEHPKQPFSPLQHWKGYKTNRTQAERQPLPDDDLMLEPGQVNYDALWLWVDAVEAAGATPLVVYVPPNPLYNERFVSPELIARFHQHLGSRLPSYTLLSPQPVENYRDFIHYNDEGRHQATPELASLLADALQ